MNENKLNDILIKYKSGITDKKTTLDEIRCLTFVDLGFAKVDMQRRERNGACEIIYAENKSADQILSIVKLMKSQEEENILVTRLAESTYRELTDSVDMKYDAQSKIAVVGGNLAPSGHGDILVVSAGTSDISVAEEAAKTAEFLGNRVRRVYDCGVAGIHRLFAHEQDIKEASVIVVVAGMEGALASVVGGLAAAPVIAVPTSVGYGTSFEGVTALLSMLNSCASGVSVVNIDNGFGAGYNAHIINHIGIKK